MVGVQEPSSGLRRRVQIPERECVRSKRSHVILYLLKDSEVRENSFSGGILAADKGWDKVSTVDLGNGRYFTDSEIENGSAVTVIGSAVMKALFPNGETPEGKMIKVGGNEVSVVGVLKPAGSSVVRIMNLDEAVMLPMVFSKSIVSPKQQGMTIVAMADDPSQGGSEE